MNGKKRRTEIHIETHEITVIRSSKTRIEPEKTELTNEASDAPLTIGSERQITSCPVDEGAHLEFSLPTTNRIYRTEAK